MSRIISVGTLLIAVLGILAYMNGVFASDQPRRDAGGEQSPPAVQETAKAVPPAVDGVVDKVLEALSRAGSIGVPRLETVMVSDLVPELMREYVLKYGADSQIMLPPELLEQVRREEPEESGAETVVKRILRPRICFAALGPVGFTGVRADQPTDATLLVSGVRTRFLDGAEIPWGRQMALDRIVTGGLVLNAGETTVILNTHLGVAELPPGGALYVPGDPKEREALQDLMLADAQQGALYVLEGPEGGDPGKAALLAVGGNGCSVTCGAGYYACCRDGWLNDTCVCIANGTVAKCDSGGPGATSCSVGPPPSDMVPLPLDPLPRDPSSGG